MNTETKPMSFEEFAKEVIARMQERYADCEVRKIPVKKSNGIQLAGIAIIDSEYERGNSLVPTIYLNGFFEDYLDGDSLDMIADRITAYHEENKGQGVSILPDLQNFSAVQNSICYRLINAEMSEEYLEGIPHRQFLNLAVTYCIPVTMPDASGATIAVTNALMDQWQIDEETLYTHAKANTERLYPPILQTMEELIEELMPDEAVPDTNCGMFALRNFVGNGGAGAMLCEDILRDFSVNHGDFYIIPSSINGVLLLPPSLAFRPVSTEELSNIVRSVNRYTISPEEVLSDNPYLYHADTNEIEILP